MKFFIYHDEFESELSWPTVVTFGIFFCPSPLLDLVLDEDPLLRFLGVFFNSKVSSSKEFLIKLVERSLLWTLSLKFIEI